MVSGFTTLHICNFFSPILRTFRDCLQIVREVPADIILDFAVHKSMDYLYGISAEKSSVAVSTSKSRMLRTYWPRFTCSRPPRSAIMFTNDCMLLSVYPLAILHVCQMSACMIASHMIQVPSFEWSLVVQAAFMRGLLHFHRMMVLTTPMSMAVATIEV